MPILDGHRSPLNPSFLCCHRASNRWSEKTSKSWQSCLWHLFSPLWSHSGDLHSHQCLLFWNVLLSEVSLEKLRILVSCCYAAENFSPDSFAIRARRTKKQGVVKSWLLTLGIWPQNRNASSELCVCVPSFRMRIRSRKKKREKGREFHLCVSPSYKCERVENPQGREREGENWSGQNVRNFIR